jgi:hypothetical protein
MGLGVFYIEEDKSDSGLPCLFARHFCLEMPIGMKYYSKVNLSMGINTLLFLYAHCSDGNRVNFLYQDRLAWGPYFAISKNFTVFRNFKIEPYFQSYLAFLFWYDDRSGKLSKRTSNSFHSVGLRLKYEI